MKQDMNTQIELSINEIKYQKKGSEADSDKVTRAEKRSE